MSGGGVDSRSTRSATTEACSSASTLDRVAAECRGRSVGGAVQSSQEGAVQSSQEGAVLEEVVNNANHGDEGRGGTRRIRVGSPPIGPRS